MSEFKFKVGDKIRLKEWGPGWVQISHIHPLHFFGFTDSGRPYAGYRKDAWIPHEEPKPEAQFDFEAKGMWVKISTHSDWFAKASPWVWDRISEDSNGKINPNGRYTKPQIMEYYDPGKPAPWAHLIEKGA